LVGLKVAQVKRCKAIPSAAVDIWHCNAFGVYSGFEGAAVRDGFEQSSYIEPTNDGIFLRGRQYTDINGMVEFDTIYPGWYQFRTVHIHIKIFIGSKEVLTTQLFFPQELNCLIQSLPPYNVRPLSPYTNENDVILRQPGIQGVWPKISRLDRMYRAILTIIVAVD
jgi:protocatechuate 3,4-dioxygenase beta subunit